MGQKIHPTGFRLAVNRNWTSKWFANSKHYADVLNEDIRVREISRFMTKSFNRPPPPNGWKVLDDGGLLHLGLIGAKHSRPTYVGRATSASPATGLASEHKAQQAALVNEALSIEG